MKKLLLFFFIPFISFSQNDFREMNWGESSKTLKEKFSNISFEKDVSGETVTFLYTENYDGLVTQVGYIFRNDKFISGAYLYGYKSYSKEAIDYLKDFFYISLRLKNKKHDMIRGDVWINDSYKEQPNDLALALSLSHVKIRELGIDDDTEIIHSLEKNEENFLHTLFYYSPMWVWE